MPAAADSGANQSAGRYKAIVQRCRIRSATGLHLRRALLSEGEVRADDSTSVCAGSSRSRQSFSAVKYAMLAGRCLSGSGLSSSR